MTVFELYKRVEQDQSMTPLLDLLIDEIRLGHVQLGEQAEAILKKLQEVVRQKMTKAIGDEAIIDQASILGMIGELREENRNTHPLGQPKIARPFKPPSES